MDLKIERKLHLILHACQKANTFLSNKGDRKGNGQESRMNIVEKDFAIPHTGIGIHLHLDRYKPCKWTYVLFVLQ